MSARGLNVARDGRAAVTAGGVLRAFVRIVPFAMLLLVAAEWNGIPGQSRDSAAYHVAATHAQDGGALYQPLPAAGPHEFVGEWPYLYPPPLAAALSLLPRVSHRTFDRAWLIANLFAFWLLAAALGRIARGAWTLEGTAAWGAALFASAGAVLCIHFGNIELIVLAIVSLGIAVPTAAGAAMATGAIIKVAPVWPLLALLTRRPRSAVAGTTVAAALAAGACALVFGVAGTVEQSSVWLIQVLPAMGQGQFWGESLASLRQGVGPIDIVGNLSVTFLPVQLAVLGGWDYAGGPLPHFVVAYLAVAGITAPLVAWRLTRHRTWQVQCAVVLAAALFAAPIVRPYVLPVLLLVIATLRQERRVLTLMPAAPSCPTPRPQPATQAP